MDQQATLRLIRSWLEANFYRRQLAWILERSPFAIALKARQIGWSDATAGSCVVGGFVQRRPQLILSASEDLAEEVLDKARTHCRTLARCGLPATQYTTDNRTEIAWKTGGRIVALPANKRTARSFSGDVHLDEFAYHLDPEGIRDGAFPMASRGGWRVRVLSTPNGAQGLFYDWASTPPDGWVVHRVTIDDAAADGFPVDLGKLWSLCGGDERIFGQWFLCRFLDADLQYYPTAMVEAALAWDGHLPDLRQARIFAGLDVGREHDLSALTVVALHGGRVFHLATFTCKRTSFKEQKAMIRRARNAFRWQKLYPDATGLGTQLAEELVEEFGSGEVEPLSFTAAVKEQLATRGLRWLRDGLVRLERGDAGKALVREAVALRRVISKAGNVSFDVPRSRDGHGDRLWSFLLALWGAGEPIAPRGYGMAPLLAVP